RDVGEAVALAGGDDSVALREGVCELRLRDLDASERAAGPLRAQRRVRRTRRIPKACGLPERVPAHAHLLQAERVEIGLEAADLREPLACDLCAEGDAARET